MNRCVISVVAGRLSVAFAACELRSSTSVAPQEKQVEQSSSVRSQMPTANTAEKEEFDFTVVDGRSGKPIPDAEVRWDYADADVPPDDEPTDIEDDQSVEGYPMYDADLRVIDARTRASGLVARSDAEGHVVLPTAVWPPIFARKGTLLGGNESLWSEDNEALKLRLWPDGNLRVRLVDSWGQALAKAAVMLIDGDARYSSFSRVRQRVMTSDDGSATLQHAFVTIASVTSRWGATGAIWHVALEMIPASAGAMELDPAALPREPITLRMPPAGEVEIALRELDGSSAKMELPVVLAEVDAENSPTQPLNARLPRLDGARSPGELSATLVDGKAVLHNIGLGRQLIAFAARNEPSRVSVLRFAGPTEPGQQVQATIVLGSDAVILTGRAQGPDGTALASARLRFELFGGWSSLVDKELPNEPTNFLSPSKRVRFANVDEREPISFADATLVTNAQGQFTIEYAIDAVYDRRPILVLGHKCSDASVLEASIDLHDVWSAGSHDLGDIRIDAIPILAAGVLVDESGAPLAGAQISVDSNQSGLHRVRNYETNERGEFELRSAKPHVKVELDVRKEGFAPSYGIKGQLGRTDWRIVLKRS